MIKKILNSLGNFFYVLLMITVWIHVGKFILHTLLPEKILVLCFNYGCIISCLTVYASIISANCKLYSNRRKLDSLSSWCIFIYWTYFQLYSLFINSEFVSVYLSIPFFSAVLSFMTSFIFAKKYMSIRAEPNDTCLLHSPYKCLWITITMLQIVLKGYLNPPWNVTTINDGFITINKLVDSNYLY